MVTFNLADLSFILQQIKIAEAHSAGTPLTELVPNPLLPWGLRTVDGTLNNIVPGRETWGSADQPFPRLTDPSYREGTAPTGFFPVPGNQDYDPNNPLNVIDTAPRTISNLIVDQTINNRAAVIAALERAGSSDPHGDADRLIAAHVTQAEADANVVTAQASLLTAQTALQTAVANFNPLDSVTVDALQTAAANLTIAEEALTHANTVAANPDAAFRALAAEMGVELTANGSLVIPNVAPDLGISAPFNSWMTLFGQFFDHGLDLVEKTAETKVYIPLQPDDPLITVGPDGIAGSGDEVPLSQAFMVVTRTLPDARNVTTPFVDQNQTYTSHASHQVFLREYAGAPGSALATGHLLEHATGGLATWADIKKQALEKLGIELTDADVHNVPVLATDLYGEFERGPNGFAQILVQTGPNTFVKVEGTESGMSLAEAAAQAGGTAVLTGHAFINDIAHHAAPGFVDLNHDGLKNGSDYDQVADADFDANGDGVYNIADFTASGITDVDSDGAITAADLTDTNGDLTIDLRDLNTVADLVADTNHDGVVDGRDFDRNNDGNIDLADFDANGDGLVTTADLTADDHNPNTYDNELLDAHYITGDGRGNENIGLTTVHHVFHSEHNRLVEHTKEVVLQSGDLATLKEWVLNPGALTTFPTTAAEIAALQWDGERLFQAARFGTEMQYQHLVFEEFARKVNPAIDLFVFNPTVDINPAIVAEFAHTIYRFGHSMLTETVDRLGVDGQTSDDIGLIEAFLNPVEFGSADSDVMAGAVIRGMTRQVGNEIDEFVTNALRNNLLGLPLDLAAINLARGREAGIATLQESRAQFYEMTKSEWLRPYTSWKDFAENLKNPTSVINFIAAYGTHEAIVSATTLEEKRTAATLLVMGDGDNSDGVTINGTTYSDADRLAFLNGSDGYTGGLAAAGALGGLNNVDLWIGGLAEDILPFGGMLGSTFTFVFEYQLERLQNADRFYYLSRTQGMHFVQELENNSFTSLVMLNTDLGQLHALSGTDAGEMGRVHLPGELFSTPEFIIEVHETLQKDYDPTGAGVDPLESDPVIGALTPKVERGTNVTINGTTYDNYLKVNGNEHMVLGGTEDDDALIRQEYTDSADDTIWGDGGNDLIVGGDGINRLFGGSGNDIIYDGGDASFIHGDAGDDVISGGAGLGELIFGGDGNDFVIGGIDGKEVFAAQGNDFILGSPDVDFLLGGEGDDWIEGAEGFDTIAGDNSELFFNSPIIGHDVMFSGTNEQDFDAESGDDIMVQGESVIRNEGMLGFDWVSFEEHNTFGANADLRVKIFTTVFADILRNRFDRVEALSGSKLGDTLVGDDRTAPTGPFNPNVPFNEATLDGDGLTRAGVERITGLQSLLGLTDAQLQAFGQNDIVFDQGNILIGGDGNDTIEGKGGNDYLDGDAWLNVRIAIKVNGVDVGTADKMQGIVTSADPNLNGKQLDTLLFDRTITPSQLSIVREILTETTQPNANLDGFNGDLDTAVFRGNLSEYTFIGENGPIVTLPGQSIVDALIAYFDGDTSKRLTVEHTNALLPGGGGVGGGLVVNDGTDHIRNFERLQFADVTVNLVAGLDQAPIVAAGTTIQALLGGTGLPADIATGDAFPVVQAGLPLRIATNPDGSLAGVTDPDNNGAPITSFTVAWQVETGAGSGIFVDVAGFGVITQGGRVFTPSPDPLIGFDGERVRAVITFVDGHGVTETVTLGPTVPMQPAPNLVGTPADDLLIGTETILPTAYNNAFGVTLPTGNDGSFAAPIDGGLGDDELRGLSGDDVLAGGAGSDITDGGAGFDTAVFDTAFGGLVTAAATPSGTVEIIIGGTENEIINIEQLWFDGNTDGVVDAGELMTNAALEASIGLVRGVSAAPETLTGTAADETFVGGAGTDTINAAGGNDAIVWNVGDGRDIVDGGTDANPTPPPADASTDTMFINGDAAVAETFRVYTRAEALAQGVVTIGQIAASTEIVVTLNGTNNDSVIAELDNIEELRINVRPINAATTDARGDAVQLFGDFTTTSLALNTFGITGGAGDDTVDLSHLTSGHRIVFNSGGGHDTIIGTLRPQDVIQVAPGTNPADYSTTHSNGHTTVSNGTHSVTFDGIATPHLEAAPAGGVPNGFELTNADLAALKALVNGLQPAGEDNVPTGVRTLDGHGNNVANPAYGAADEPFIRITDASYGENGSVNPIHAGLDPRTISNVLGVQEADLAPNANGANIFFMAFGQYFDHGLDFLPKGGNGSIAIGGPGYNPGASNPADLTRGEVSGYDANGVPQHLNKTSPYVDQNQAYGSNSLVGQFLREGDGHGGIGAHLFQGGVDPSNDSFQLLPTLRELIHEHWENNTVFKMSDGSTAAFQDYYAGLVDPSGVINNAMVAGLNSNFMGSGQTLVGDANPFISVLDHYVAGDLRANENVTLTSIHTIWARNHNYHVENLEAAGFQGTAEELFQAAKILNEAEYQRVVFGEFADMLIGGIKGTGSHGHDKYNPDATSSISHEFAAAVYRVGHSLIGQTIEIVDANGQVHQVSLVDAFLNPTNDSFGGPLPPGYVPQPGFEQLGVNGILQGIVGQQAEEVDFNLVDAVRNDLVRLHADLFAFNVARGWDVGLGTLNQIRHDLANSTNPYIVEARSYAGNLNPYTSWEDFQARNGLSNAVIEQFKQAYPDLQLAAADIAAFQAINPDIQVLVDPLTGLGTVKGIDRVDVWVGGLAEAHINGGMVGQTFWVVLQEQFDRLQEGDRFYYTDRLDGLDLYENFIDGTTLADIISRNTGLENLPEHIFETPEADDENTAPSSPAAIVLAASNEDTSRIITEAELLAGSGDVDGDTLHVADLKIGSGGGSLVDNGNGTWTYTPAANDDTGVTFTFNVTDGSAKSGIVTASLDLLPVADPVGLVLSGDARKNKIFGGEGDDRIHARSDDDKVFGGAGNDKLNGNGGNDVVWGGTGDDMLNGATGKDRLHGQDGRDILLGKQGDDRLFGDGGDDVLDGGSGRDILTGGAGSDRFVFNPLSALGNSTATRDVITDFEGGGIAGGDTIDLSGIDALAGGSDDAFTFKGTDAFDGLGQIRVQVVNGNTIVSGNVTGDLGSDFQIEIKGIVTLTDSDFSL